MDMMDHQKDEQVGLELTKLEPLLEAKIAKRSCLMRRQGFLGKTKILRKTEGSRERGRANMRRTDSRLRLQGLSRAAAAETLDITPSQGCQSRS